MNDLRKAAEMALEALEHVDRFDLNRRFCFDEEIDTLRQALAQPEQAHTDHPMRHWDRTCPACVAEPWDTSDMAYRPNGLSVEQEPVAWMAWNMEDECYVITTDKRRLPAGTPLYTAPPSKPEPVKLKNLRDVHAAQGSDGTWNSDQYMCGLFNGLELALAIFENREPVYKELAQPEQEPVACECHRCIKENDLREGAFPLSATRMILCPECGNKRCPKASDHRLACTGSNESGQEGSIYTAPPSKPWVSLTMRDYHKFLNLGTFEAFKAIDAKLKELNHG